MVLRVHSLESFGTHEWPGIRYVIFLQGCLFRCAYCHNPDTIPLEWWKMMTVEDIMHNIQSVKDYFGTKWGVTVSWWEPLLQAKEILPLFQQLHAEWVNTTLDTNWYIRNDDVKKLLDETDLILLDVKHINPDWHKKLTGKSNDNVLELAQYLFTINKPIWLRYVYVPGWTDQEEYLHEWAKTFSSYINIQRVEILPYHRLGVYKWKELWRSYALDEVQPPTMQSVDKCKFIFEQYFPLVRIR